MIFLSREVQLQPPAQPDLLLSVVPDGDEGVPGPLESDGVREMVEAASHVNSDGIVRPGVGSQDSQSLQSELKSFPGLRLAACSHCQYQDSAGTQSDLTLTPHPARPGQRQDSPGRSRHQPHSVQGRRV